MHKSLRSLAVLVVSATLASGLVACSSGNDKIALSDGAETTAPDPASGDTGGGVGMGGTGPTGNVEDAPADSPKDDRFTYQDDVVFVGGGEEAAVVAASSDGLTYQLDGGSPGVADLQVGSVLYVSPTLTGRVLSLAAEGGDVVVSLGPVDLPEIFRDAVFDLDYTYDTDETSFQAYPDFGPGIRDLPPEPEVTTGTDVTPEAPSTGGSADGTIDPDTAVPEEDAADAGAGTEPSKLHGRGRATDAGTGADATTGDDIVRLPPLSVTLGAQPPRLDPTKTLPAKEKSRLTFEAEGWSFSPYASATSLGVEISRETDAKTKFSADLSLKISRINLIVDTVISGGLYTKNTMKVEGIDGIAIDAAAGSSIGADGSLKIAMDVPVVDFKAQVPGEPLVYAFKMSVAVGAAFGGNNATVSAGGRYSLTGPIGIEDGKVVAPTLAVEQSLVDSIGGISLAPTGATIGLGVTISVGVGIPILFAGPFGKIAFDVGFANGSSLGASLARCRQGTLDIWSGGGIGFSITSEVNDWLTKKLGKKAKIKGDVGVMANVFHRTVLVPDVPLCGGAPSAPGAPSAGDDAPN